MNDGSLDINKTKSIRKAILLFFKTFFPSGFTWKEVVDFIKDKSNKDPVGQVRKMRATIKL